MVEKSSTPRALQKRKKPGNFFWRLGRAARTAYLRTEIVHDPELHSEGVVADGPYRHLRNPLYLGNILLDFAMGLVASRLGFVVLIVGTFVIFLRLIGREEAELLKVQGESHRAYRDAVPRLWPALRPRLPASGARPVWWQAFWGETLFWVLFLACVWLALTFDTRGFQVIVFVGLILYIVLSRVWKRRREQGAPT